LLVFFILANKIKKKNIMIPLVLAILIYQFLAFLGVEAIGRLVIYIAYYKQDLDLKLMYNQAPIDLIYSFNKFDKPNSQKMFVFFMASIALAFGFIPTIFTEFDATAFLYYDYITSPLNRSDAINNYNWPSTLPVFDRIIPFLTNPTNTSLQDMVNNYIIQHLRQNTTQNPSGHWFGVNNIETLYYDDRQANLGGENFNVMIEGSNYWGNQTYSAFSTFRQGDSETRDSLTMSSCSKDPSLLITNLSSIHGTRVQGSLHYDNLCYPIYDPTMSVYLSRKKNGQEYRNSLLNANDTIYRQTKLTSGLSAMSSFGVAIYNHNETHSTMAIKKTAHITMYNYNKTIDPPGLDCASLAAGKSNYSQNFIDLPYNSVLCQLMQTKRENPQIQIIQAAGRYAQDNWMVSSVYTHQRGGMYDDGDSVMLDLASFTVFNVRGNLTDDDERMIAYEGNRITRDNNNGFIMTMANDSIGQILKELDPSMISNETAAILMGLASMRIRWTAEDYSDFQLTRASVIGAVETPVWWIVIICVLVFLFLSPHVTRVLVRRAPQYEDDLRTILISTLNNTQHVTQEGKSKAKTLNLSVVHGQEQSAKTVLLTVDNEPIVAAAKLEALLLQGQNDNGKGLVENFENVETEEYELLNRS
jgi:hypothetical protein